ncbi:MAG: DUF2612 domain-containing protein [Pseudomonadota bacterium]|nr:DUF2612 domain-containing protein [Pseudomonadota bacterium]
MINFEQTIISQYANSPTLIQLVENFNQYIDPQADLDNFYNYVWNVQTAKGFGLDIWGKIVGISRNLTITGTPVVLGFKEAAGAAQPFGQAPFYNGQPDTNTYILGDDAYRTLILVKALSNISTCTSQSYNQLLQNLFAGRGRCYVNDLGNMKMRYTFEFYLQPFEIAIVTQSQALPRPAAVSATVLQVDVPSTLGFNEAGVYQTFGHGVFGGGTLAVN